MMDKADVAKELVRLSKELTAGGILRDTPDSAVSIVRKMKRHVQRSLAEVEAAMALIPTDFEGEDDYLVMTRGALKDAKRTLVICLEDIGDF